MERQKGKEGRGRKERKGEGERSPVDWFTVPALDQAMSRDQDLLLVSHMGTGAQALRPSHTISPRLLGKSQIGSETVKNQCLHGMLTLHVETLPALPQC